MKAKFFSFLFVFLTIGLWTTSVKAQTMMDDMAEISPCSFDSAATYSGNAKICTVQDGVSATSDNLFQYNYFIYKVTNFEAKQYSVNIKFLGGTAITTCNVDFFSTLDSACTADNTKGAILSRYPLLNVNAANTKVINSGVFKEYQWVTSFSEARQTKYMRIYVPMGVAPWYHAFKVGTIRFEVYNPKNQLKAKMDEVVSTRALLDSYVADTYKTPLINAYNASSTIFNDVVYDNIQGQPDKQAVVVASTDTLDAYLSTYKSHIEFIPDPTKDYVMVRKDSSYLYAHATNGKFYLNLPVNMGTGLTDNDFAHFTVARGTDGRYTLLNIGTGLYIGTGGLQNATAATFLMKYMATKATSSGVKNLYFTLYNANGTSDFLDANGDPGYDYVGKNPGASTAGLGNWVGFWHSGIPANDKCWYYFVPVDKKPGVLKGALKAVLDIANNYTTESGILVGSGYATAENENLIYNQISAAQAVYEADPAGQTQAEIDAAKEALNNAMTTFKATIKFTPKPNKVYRLTTTNSLSFAQSKVWNKAGVLTSYGYDGLVVLTDNGADSVRWIITEGTTPGTYSLRNKASLKYMNNQVKMDTIPFYFSMPYIRLQNSNTPIFAGKGMTGGQNFDVDGSAMLENNKVSYWGTAAVPDAKNLFSITEFIPTTANPNAVRNVSVQKFKVYGVTNAVLIKDAENETATIITLEGKVTQKVFVKGSPATIQLARGFYLVKVGNEVTKVIVK
jgi:hypothetical protein